MPVTHSDLFHSWRIRSGVRGAAAAPRGSGTDGSRHCFCIVPVTCLKPGPAAGRLQARRAVLGGSLRFGEDQHGARHGRPGALFRRNIFLPSSRHRPARSTSLSYRKLPVISSGPGYLSSGIRPTSNRGQRLSLWWTAPWSLCPYLPSRRRLHGGFTSLAESVSETCSNSDQEIALSNSNLCIFCQD